MNPYPKTNRKFSPIDQEYFSVNTTGGKTSVRQINLSKSLNAASTSTYCLKVSTCKLLAYQLLIFIDLIGIVI
jgi:hypothetical protein